MKSILEFYGTSIGKKIFMSLTGLFLITFLLEHLVGNLLLYANDNGKMYEAYGEFLVSNPVIRTIEFVLFGSAILHALLGAWLWYVNKTKRPEKYRYFRLKDNTPLASRTTIISGLMILAFLVVHLDSFFFPTRFGQETSTYHLILLKFSNPWYDLFYLVAFLLLGYHLKHGFQSAFQTLGLRGKAYTPFLDGVAFIIWFLVPLAFATIPVYFYFFQPTSAALMGVH